MCKYTNYSFIGAPAGEDQVVTYTMNYANPNSDDSCLFSSKQQVFDTAHTITPPTCYCSNLNFDSLEPSGAGAYKQYTGANTPYNFASLFTQFDLVVSNVSPYTDPVDSRSAGLDLSGVTQIKIGFWMKSTGRHNGHVTKCPARNYDGGVNNATRLPV